MASFMSHLSAAGVTLTRDWSAPAPLGAVPKMTPPARQVSEAPAAHAAKPAAKHASALKTKKPAKHHRGRLRACAAMLCEMTQWVV